MKIFVNVLYFFFNNLWRRTNYHFFLYLTTNTFPSKHVFPTTPQSNEWCATGVEILAGEGGLIAVDKLIEDAKTFGLTAPDEFREMLMQSATQETRALVTQVPTKLLLTLI